MSQAYDQDYWGPGGIDISRWHGSCGRGIDFHAAGLQHGQNSKFAQDLRAAHAKRERASRVGASQSGPWGPESPR